MGSRDQEIRARSLELDKDGTGLQRRAFYEPLSRGEKDCNSFQKEHACRFRLCSGTALDGRRRMC